MIRSVMTEITIGKIVFSDLRLAKRQIPSFRGAVSHLFRQFDLLHNHAEDGRVLYRYAAVQFKTEKGQPIIYAVGERAIEVFKPIFLEIDKIDLDGTVYPVMQKELAIRKEKTGLAEEDIVYRLMSPWIALNQYNYDRYLSSGEDEKRKILEGIAVNNIIGFAKYAQYTVPGRITVSLKVRPVNVSLKGEQLLGFVGYLKTNFLLPDLLGLGKSVSRGYGVVKRVF
jgi:hypothetical protein